MDGLGEACGVGIDLLVGGVGDISVGVACFGVEDAAEEGEVVLGAPEAAAGEVDVADGGMERGEGAGEDVGELLEVEAVGVVEGVEAVAVDVEDGPGACVIGGLRYFVIGGLRGCVSGRGEEEGDYYLAAGLGAAGDVAGELLDVGDDDGASLLPGGAADAFAEGDVGAGDGALEGGEDELGAGDAVEARPPEAEGVVEEGGGVGEEGGEIGGVGGELCDLLEEELVLTGFGGGGGCIHGGWVFYSGMFINGCKGTFYFVFGFFYFAGYLYLCRVELKNMASYKEIHISDLGCIGEIQQLCEAQSRGLQVPVTEH